MILIIEKNSVIFQTCVFNLNAKYVKKVTHFDLTIHSAKLVVWLQSRYSIKRSVQNYQEHYLYSLLVFFRFRFCLVKFLLNICSLLFVFLSSELSFSILESFASSIAHLASNSVFLSSDFESFLERLEIVTFDEAE